jgi:transposase-like protein
MRPISPYARPSARSCWPVWDAPSLESAEAELKHLVAGYRTAAPKLAEWLENNVPEGFAVFKLPRDHWRRMRTSNPIERSIQQELKRRTQKIRVFPNEASLIRLVSAILAAKPSSTGGRPPPRNRCGCPRPRAPKCELHLFLLLKDLRSAISEAESRA